ncbi:hypothetical protein BOM24_15430 [Tatumella sp. OPLPL6]|nr:hypothetical protein BOM24_15430 [Tatumella sp. OPLPL6]
MVKLPPACVFCNQTEPNLIKSLKKWLTESVQISIMRPATPTKVAQKSKDGYVAQLVRAQHS